MVGLFRSMLRVGFRRRLRRGLVLLRCGLRRKLIAINRDNAMQFKDHNTYKNEEVLVFETLDELEQDSRFWPPSGIPRMLLARIEES